MRIPKLRWLLLLAVVLSIWRYSSHAPEEPASTPAPPMPEAAPLSGPVIPPKPRRMAAKKARRPARHEAIVVMEKPGPLAPLAQPRPLAVASPQPMQAGSLLEDVAFKDEEEVLEMLGEADETVQEDGRSSWYYSKPALSRQGKPICPEVRFIDGQARMVIMWTPEKMQEMIATARSAKTEGAQETKGPQTFTFLDSFKYLGVGTPQELVLEDLGEPDSKKNGGDTEEWNYDTLIVENGASRRLTVLLRKGKVIEVRGR